MCTAQFPTRKDVALAEIRCFALHALKEAACLVQADKKVASVILKTPHALGWTGFINWAAQMQMIAL